MRAIPIIVAVLLALGVASTAEAEHSKTCHRMRLYVVTGHKVEPQFRVYTGRIASRGASCPVARSVVRALNQHLLTTTRHTSVRASGRRWNCVRTPNYGTGYLDSRCHRSGAQVEWSQSAILD